VKKTQFNTPISGRVLIDLSHIPVTLPHMAGVDSRSPEFLTKGGENRKPFDITWVIVIFPHLISRFTEDALDSDKL